MSTTKYRLFAGVTPGIENLLSAELSRTNQCHPALPRTFTSATIARQKRTPSIFRAGVSALHEQRNERLTPDVLFGRNHARCVMEDCGGRCRGAGFTGSNVVGGAPQPTG